MNQLEPLDIIIPISLDQAGASVESIERSILEQKDRFGFSKFALFGPGKGWRAKSYPPRQCFSELAQRILRISKDLEPHGIVCGWWITTTLKSGPSDEFVRPVKGDGSVSPFSSCPADPHFRRRLCKDVAEVARIAKPAFIITEDDLSIRATTFSEGCFCRCHLEGFAQKEGRYYSREELQKAFSVGDEASYALLYRWRAFMKETLVTLARELRAALDVESPEIPLGYMQAGGADWDGDCTEAVARAMAGDRHTPFARLYGTFYCGGDTKDLPKTLYHPIYFKQHIPMPFRFYHESDSYPHIRFFTSASQMRAMMAIAYANGFDGSTFQTQQMLDDPNEEPAYGKMFSRARAKMETLHRVAKQCVQKGVEVCYDPFWNTVDKSCQQTEPLWAKCVGLFGIPYVTTASATAFWDVRQARYADDATVRRYLSKHLFLDGEAARVLCERGYGEYLGIEVGESVAVGSYRFDLGANDVIREAFSQPDGGRMMAPAHAYACGGEGELLRLLPRDDACEIVSEEINFEGVPVSVSMTHFANRLGGRVTVFGEVLDGNRSQSLYNYRRQRLFQRLVAEGNDTYVFIKDAPGTYLVMNEATNRDACGFLGMLTLVNLCDDSVDSFSLHLPATWHSAREFFLLGDDGEWYPTPYERTEDGIALTAELRYCEPLCILAR